MASFEFPSRFNDSVEVLDVAIALFEKAAQKHISRDKSPSGMLSRRDLVSLHGKTLQEVLNTLEIDEAESLRGMEELKTAIGHLDDRKIRKAPFHPEVRDSVNDIIDSIAVSVSSDGIIMLHSKPNPIFQKEYPVQRDWRLIELTKPENVEAALKKALENQLTTQEDGEWINYYSPAGELVARKRYTGETGNED